MSKLSEHFDLKELIPEGFTEADVPHPVLANLTVLASTILEPVRERFGPVQIHSGWRPAAKNDATAGASATSDHMSGRAADFHVWPNDETSWEDNTFAAHEWIRLNLAGKFGQLILEDHRAHYSNPQKLWLHVSLVSGKHPGTEKDPNRLLVSGAPKEYTPWVDQRFA